MFIGTLAKNVQPTNCRKFPCRRAPDSEVQAQRNALAPCVGNLLAAWHLGDAVGLNAVDPFTTKIRCELSPDASVARSHDRLAVHAIDLAAQ
jgi:hypothetical protein